MKLTPEQVESLLADYLAGMTYRAIGTKYGITAPAISHWVGKYGLLRRDKERHGHPCCICGTTVQQRNRKTCSPACATESSRRHRSSQELLKQNTWSRRWAMGILLKAGAPEATVAALLGMSRQAVNQRAT